MQAATPASGLIRRITVRTTTGQPFKIAVVALTISLLLVYAAFPTRNHYWDGIGFALNIEGTAQSLDQGTPGKLQMLGSQIYFNPNHLLYNLLGYIFYLPIYKLLPHIRALRVLAAISMILSTATVVLQFLMMARWTKDFRLSLWLTLLMAFSATWWKFSTDANAYVPSVFLLVVCMFLFTNPLRCPPVVIIGLLHALSILVHQISVLFFPAALLAIWTHSSWSRGQNKRRVALYVLTSGGVVITAYLWVWFDVLGRDLSVQAFLGWITFNGPEEYDYQSVVSSVITSLKSLRKLFLGGRVSLALTFVEPPLLALMLSAMVLLLTNLVRRVWELRSGPAVPARMVDGRFSKIFLTTWLGVFSAFLSLWLIEYPYYRLFCMPALLLCLAMMLKRHAQLMKLLPSLVMFLAAFNFTFLIYPYSKLEATPPIRLAHEAKAIWKGNVVVLYEQPTCDNWIMQYFNPHTEWAQIDLNRRDQVARKIGEAFQAGQHVWLDTSVIGRLGLSLELLEWLQGLGTLTEAWGISNGRHHIQFVELLPLSRAASELSGACWLTKSESFC
jgi:hypothetical protein